MDFWLIALGFAIALVLTAFFWPFQLTMSLQARGAEDGNFAAAGGAQLGPFTVTAVVARGVPFNVGVRVFGRLLTASTPEGKHEPSTPRPAPPWLGKFAASIDPADVIDYLLGNRRWFGLVHLELGLDYSSKNVALTGQILAGLCAASALLPSKVTLRQTPSWELVNRASLSVDGRFRLRPGLFICDTLWFLLRTRMLPERSAARAS